MSHPYLKTLIQTDSNGLVAKTLLDTQPYNYSIGAFSYPNDPVIIDNDIANLYYNRTRIEDGVSVVDSVPIHPYTEQMLSGNLYGGFELNEQVYQTPVPVEVVNYLAINGQTASSYAPVVGTIGVSGGLGKRAARFFGTYNDLPSGKGAGLKLPKIDTGTFFRFMVEGFVYFESLPTAYDPILITRGVDAVGGTTHDSFSVEYNVADRRMVLKYNRGVDGSTAAGFAETLNITPQDGVTTNKWHHFAFSMGITIDENSGGKSMGVATFFDGTRVGYNETAFSESINSATNPTVRGSVAPIMVGCGLSGERPLKGWLDSVMISGGGSQSALRGYHPHLSTITVPQKEKISVGEFTVYYLNMTGPLGTNLFPCDMPNRMVSTASYISEVDGKLGVALVSRQTSTINSTALYGLTLFSGVCYGHAMSGLSASPCFGLNSGSCIVATTVEQLHELERAKRIRQNAAEFTISYLLGSTGMQGVSGASGDFRRFFTQNWGGTAYSYLPTQTNTSQMQFTYDSIVVSGRTGTFFIKDFFTNTVYGVATADIQNLYADVVEYHSLCVRLGASASGRLYGLTGMEPLYNAKGFEEEPIVRRVAPRINNVGILYINNYGRMNKTTSRPELIYDPYSTEGVHYPTIVSLAGSPTPTSPIPY